MKLGQGWALACLAVAMLSAAGLSRAANVTPEDEYKKLVRVSDEIQPLGENPFGESISLYNGSLSFQQTDINLAGDGPTIQLVRSFRIRDAKESEVLDGAFSDWSLELPRITTVAATAWQVNAADRNARCTSFAPPPGVSVEQDGSVWKPDSWWAGYQLVVPGSGSQDLLYRTVENTLAPQMSGTDFPIVTKQNWMIGCLPSTDGTELGEAFFAISPGGTRYWFDHMVYRWAPTLERPVNSSGSEISRPVLLRRRNAELLVTKIQDRFGNSLVFNYDGANLISIQASDGRKLNLAYEPGTHRITSAAIQGSDGTRRWLYEYGDDYFHTLKRVALPMARPGRSSSTDCCTERSSRRRAVVARPPSFPMN